MLCSWTVSVICAPYVSYRVYILVEKRDKKLLRTQSKLYEAWENAKDQVVICFSFKEVARAFNYTTQ